MDRDLKTGFGQFPDRQFEVFRCGAKFAVPARHVLIVIEQHGCVNGKHAVIDQLYEANLEKWADQLFLVRRLDPFAYRFFDLGDLRNLLVEIGAVAAEAEVAVPDPDGQVAVLEHIEKVIDAGHIVHTGNAEAVGPVQRSRESRRTLRFRRMRPRRTRNELRRSLLENTGW